MSAHAPGRRCTGVTVGRAGWSGVALRVTAVNAADTAPTDHAHTPPFGSIPHSLSRTRMNFAPAVLANHADPGGDVRTGAACLAASAAETAGSSEGFRSCHECKT